MVSGLAARCLLVTMLAAGGVPCAGWQASAEARHDCCAEGACPAMLGQAADHSDISQEAADRCCATSEQKDQRDGSQSPAASFAVPPQAPSNDVPHTAVVYFRCPPPDTFPTALPGAPLYVLFSVFLV